jgi:hypothetical protein
MRIAALVLIAAAALIAPGQAAPLLKFQSTQDYIRLCGVAQPVSDCRAGFVAANSWVRFNSDTQLCLPDQKQSFGSPEFNKAVDAEVAGVIGWLNQHPEFISLDYARSLGEGLIAVYGCK